MPDSKSSDAPQKSWVDSLPMGLRLYARLARFDRPIGTWLLFWPCVWGVGMATTARDSVPSIWLLVLFGLGAFVMRGAGCVYNDLIDSELDGKVKRTKNRPLASGQISVRRAGAFMIGLCLLGLAILLQLDIAAIALGFMSVALVAIYPFMKRITWWPQLFLGLTFNWGVLIGYASFVGDLSYAALALYGAGIFWTLGYDTIYAHQDKEDDALVGIKSSARWLGTATRPALIIFYGLTLFGVSLAASLEGLSDYFWLGILAIAAHFIWQIKQLDIDDADVCLKLFKSNRDVGMLIALAIFLGGL